MSLMLVFAPIAIALGWVGVRILPAGLEQFSNQK